MSDVVVLIDRQQGGAARMASNGLRLHSAFTLTFILDVLVRLSFSPAVTIRLRSSHNQGRGWLADVVGQGLRITLSSELHQSQGTWALLLCCSAACWQGDAGACRNNLVLLFPFNMAHSQVRGVPRRPRLCKPSWTITRHCRHQLHLNRWACAGAAGSGVLGDGGVGAGLPGRQPDVPGACGACGAARQRRCGARQWRCACGRWGKREGWQVQPAAMLSQTTLACVCAFVCTQLEWQAICIQTCYRPAGTAAGGSFCGWPLAAEQCAQNVAIASDEGLDTLSKESEASPRAAAAQAAV